VFSCYHIPGKEKENSVTNTVVIIEAAPTQTVHLHHNKGHSHSLVLISATVARKLNSAMWRLSWKNVNPEEAFLQFPQSSTTNAQMFYQKSPDNFFPCHQT
jgi:hypothetical protein